MKKTLIALAALGAMAGANAQSTVTLYGLIDANVQSIKSNVAGATAGTAIYQRQTRIESGGLNGSRWGMRISEDLGGGMAAVANLESGFNVDTGASGQSSTLFGRRANVGVSSSSFGTVVLGRNSSSYDDVSADHAMMAQSIFDPSNNNNGPAATPTGVAGLVTRTGNPNTSWIGFQTRFNNSVKYTSPNFSGFSGSFMYAMGEDKAIPLATSKASKSISANLKYANGPLLVSGGYQSEAQGGTLGANGVASVNTANDNVKPALENMLLNVAYDFGVVKVGAGFNRAKFKDVFAPASLGGGAIDPQKEVSLSVAVPLGATTLSAGVARSKGDTLGKSTGFGVQALYSLSKRSTLYAGAQSTKGYDKLIAATPGAGDKTTTYGLGVRHTF
jgi:predicted porin